MTLLTLYRRVLLLCVSFGVHRDVREKEEWLSAINAAIKEQQEKSSVERGTVAPLWHPDATTSACSKCSKAFSLLNRRHHCRNCGHVVCDGCSNKRLLVEHVDARREVRVCAACYQTLTGATVEIGDCIDDDSDDEGVKRQLSSDEHCADGERSQVDESDLHDFNEHFSNMPPPPPVSSPASAPPTVHKKLSPAPERAVSPMGRRQSALGDMFRSAAASGTNFLTVACSKMRETRSSIYTGASAGSAENVATTQEAKDNDVRPDSATQPCGSPTEKWTPTSAGADASPDVDPTTPPPKPPRPARKTQRRLNIVLSPDLASVAEEEEVNDVEEQPSNDT
jgi:hypothetical protein